MSPHILTAIDVGTFSVVGICAKKDFKTNQVEVLAKAESPCFGVRNGEVVKPLEVAVSIAKVKSQLEEKTNLKIKQAIVNIGGGHLFAQSSQGLVSVSRADQKVSKEDVERVIKAAKAVNLPSNKEIIEVLPQEFVIDGEGGIKEPLGLQGIRLEARVLLVCLFSPVLDNLGRAFSEAGLELNCAIPSPIAAARAVLTKEQKELGVALLDIGSGLSSLAVFEKGDLVNFAVFPVGSANITNDIAILLRTEIQTAEDIKRQFGSLRSLKAGAVNKRSKAAAKDKIVAPGKNLNFSGQFLKNVIEARVSEIFSEAQKALKKIAGHQQLPSGIVLTGGGSNLPGIVEFARQKFQLPCCLGRTQGISQLEEPKFSTAAGLLLHGFDGFGSVKEASSKPGLLEKIKKVFRVFLP